MCQIVYSNLENNVQSFKGLYIEIQQNIRYQF